VSSRARNKALRARGEKYCPDCELDLPLDMFFPVRRWRRDGSSFMMESGYCKECTYVRQRESRQRVKQAKIDYAERMRVELGGYVVEKLGPPTDESEALRSLED
jgi:hypothetical protein